MGGDGSGRKPDLIKALVGNKVQPLNPIALAGDEGIFLPNNSGEKIKIPTRPFELVNKKYVDDSISQIAFPVPTPAGSNKEIQFNDNGTFGADGRFIYDQITNTQSVDNLNVEILIQSPHAQSQPARALGTIYQNTTGHPIIVYGSASCLWTDNNAADLAYFTCYSDSASTPVTVRMKAGTTNNVFLVVANLVAVQSFPFYFVVANGDYYRIVKTISGAGTVTLDIWNEVNF